jgi:hypothetical protein
VTKPKSPRAQDLPKAAGIELAKCLFKNRLANLTNEKRSSLYRQLRNTADTEKRSVFDEGLLRWARSIVKCAVDDVQLFSILEDKKNVLDQERAAEAAVLDALFAFLGVEFGSNPELWPECNQVEVFTRAACFCGLLLPAWFDVGFLLAGRLSPTPPTQMGKDVSRWHMHEVYRRFSMCVLDGLMDAFDRRALLRTGIAVPSESDSVEPPKAPKGRGKLSRFDELAGRLMFDARPLRRSNGRLPSTEYDKILAVLDSEGLKPLDHLEPRHRRELASWNTKHSRSGIPIRSFAVAFKSARFKDGVQKRLSRAEARWSQTHLDLSA